MTSSFCKSTPLWNVGGASVPEVFVNLESAAVASAADTAVSTLTRFGNALLGRAGLMKMRN